MPNEATVRAIAARADDYAHNTLPVPLAELIVQVAYVAVLGLGPLHASYSRERVDAFRAAMIDVAANAVADEMRATGRPFAAVMADAALATDEHRRAWDGKHTNRPEAWFTLLIATATRTPIWTADRTAVMLDVLAVALDAVASIDAQRASAGRCFYEA
jgi:hypothetical protein